MAAVTKLEILTPEEEIYTGEVEELDVITVKGSEGYLPGHVWCRKLLKEDGKVTFREPGSPEHRELKTRGGFVEVRDAFTVYAESAEWIKGNPAEDEED